MVDRAAVTAVVIDSSAATRGAAEFDRATDRIKQANQGAVAGSERVTKALGDVARATERAAKAQAAAAAAAERARKVSEASGATAERVAKAQAAAAAAAARAQKATEGLAAANDKAAKAQAGALREGERLNAITGDQTRKLDQLRRQLDPAAAATDALAAKTALLDRALSNGRISADEHATLLGKLKERYDDAGDAADDAAKKQQRAANRIQQLSPQLSDIATQLGSGTGPMQVLIQQGPQIADIFGGIPTLLGKIPGPAKAAAAAMAALAVPAFLVGSRMAEISSQTRRFEVIARTVNPALKGMTEELRNMANAAGERGGISRSEAGAVLEQLMRVRAISATVLGDLTALSGNIGAVFGKTPQEVATELAAAMSRGAAGIREYDEALEFLKPGQIEHIEQLDREGKRAEMLGIAVGALTAKYGDAAKQLRSDWGNATKEMGDAWDRLIEGWATDPRLLAIAAKITSIGAGIIGALTPTAGGNSAGTDELTGKMTALKVEIAAAKLEADRLAAAAADGVGMIGDPAGEALDRLIALQDKLAELERQKEQLAKPPAGATTTPPPENGPSHAEQNRIRKASEAYQKETDAMRGNALQRQINIAALEAERALPDDASPAERRQARELAELRVRRDMAIAIGDENAALDLNVRKTLEVAAAYGVSTEAGLRAEAARQAAIEAQQSGVDAAQRARDILRQAGADAFLGGAQDLDRMRGDVAGLGRLAAGVSRGPAAGIEAMRAAEAEAAYRERIAAASEAGDQRIVEGLKAQRTEYETLLRQRDEYNRKIAMAGTTKEMQDELAMIELEGTLIGATNERREREVELLRLRQDLIAAGYTGAELDAEYERLGKIVEQRARLTEATRKSTEEFERNRQAAFDGLNIMRDGFEDLVLNGEKFTDVLKNMSKAFLQLGMDLIVMEPLKRMVTELMQGGSGGGGMTPGSYTPAGGSSGWGTVASLIQTGISLWSGNVAGAVAGASQLAGAAGPVTGVTTATSGGYGGAPVLPVQTVQLHAGGIVGRDGEPRQVPSSVFVQAPRMHTGGMRPGERAVIMQDGEEVLTAGNPRHRRNFRGAGTSVVMNITTPDANSFRSSQGQLSASAGRAIAIASRRNG